MTPEISCTCLGNGLLCLGKCQSASPAASQLSGELSGPTDLQIYNASEMILNTIFHHRWVGKLFRMIRIQLPAPC